MSKNDDEYKCNTIPYNIVNMCYIFRDLCLQWDANIKKYAPTICYNRNMQLRRILQHKQLIAYKKEYNITENTKLYCA